MNFDAHQFVEQIRSKYWLGMLAAIDGALITAARWPATQRRAGAFHPGDDVEFMRFLSAARSYLLSEGRLRPAGLSDVQFLELRPLCEQLVQRGRFAPDTLKLFEELDPWTVRQAPDAPETTGADPERLNRA